jgi:hypothetical protein
VSGDKSTAVVGSYCLLFNVIVIGSRSSRCCGNCGEVTFFPCAAYFSLGVSCGRNCVWRGRRVGTTSISCRFPQKMKLSPQRVSKMMHRRECLSTGCPLVGTGKKILVTYRYFSADLSVSASCPQLYTQPLCTFVDKMRTGETGVNIEDHRLIATSPEVEI